LYVLHFTDTNFKREMEVQTSEGLVQIDLQQYLVQVDRF